MAASKPVTLLREENDGNAYLSRSPALSSQALNNVQTQECHGVLLQTPWTFWLDKTLRGASAAEYEANLKKIYTVKTAEGFWSVYHNIPSVAEIQMRYSYHLMRHELRPLWEEPFNSQGGTWRIKCAKRDTVNVWRELLLAAIGEQLSDCVAPGDDICGLSVSVRERDDLVQVWNRFSHLHEQGTVIDKILQLCPEADIIASFYKPHQTHHAFEGTKSGSQHSAFSQDFRL